MLYLSTKKKIFIALVDSNRLLTEGLKLILNDLENEFTIIDQQNSLDILSENFKNHEPHIVLTELFSGDSYGVSELKKFITEHPETKVIVYSVSAEKEHVLEALKNGAVGYLLKSAEVDAVIEALRIVFKGDFYVDPLVVNFLVEEIHFLNDQIFSNDLFTIQLADPPLKIITSREMEIVHLLVQGHNNKSISEVLQLSEKTVKNHISNILSKLKLVDRTQVVLKAIKNGWVEL